MLNYLAVGFVLKPRGLKGEIKVEPLTDDLKRFDDLDKIYLKSGQVYREASILSRNYSNGFVYLMLEGYQSRESAEQLRDQYLWVPRSMAVELPDDTFFVADLIGCSVKTANGQCLGKIINVLQTGSNDVYEVEGEKGNILIPALRKVVVDVNLSEAEITVDLTDMEELLPDEF